MNLLLIRFMCASFFPVPNMLLVESMSDENGVGGPLSAFPKEHITFRPIFPIRFPPVGSY